MARNDRTTAGPYWTRNWIEKMWRFTAENFVNFDTGDVDFEALGREEYEFRKALFYRNFKNSERAKETFNEAEEGYKTNVENGKKGGRPRKNPQDAPNGNAGEDCKSSTSCDQFTADGDTREDSQDIHDGSNSGIPESGTSANHYGPRQAEARQSRRTVAPSTGATSSTATVRSGRKFRNKEEFIQWAIDDGLDPVDAGECWEATEERGGKDADGNTVKNMKAFARQWCRTRKDNRRTA